jgi:hypothetical protein
MDALSSFLSGKQAGIGLQQQKLALDEAKQSAPHRAAMRDVTLERQQQQLQSRQGAQSLQGMQLLGQFSKRAKQLPLEQRVSLFENVKPALEKFGVDINGIDYSTDFTDAGLAELDTGLGQVQQQMTGGERQREQLKREVQGAIDPNTGQLKPIEEMTALEISAARKLDMIPGAGTDTKDERLIKDPDKAAKIGEALATIGSAVTEAKIKAKGRGDTAVELASSGEAGNARSWRMCV